VATDEAGATSLSRQVHEASQLLPAGTDVIEDVIVDADPSAALLHLASDPHRVLCLASHDHPPAEAAILGSVGSRVIERAVRPLLVVGGAAEATAAGNDVAVALDGQHDPEPLLATALHWALLLDAPLRLLTVYEPVLSDIRRPEHFTRSRGPSIDADRYLQQVRARVEGAAVRGVESVSIPDPVSVTDGLADHLAQRPALLLVVGGEHHRHLLTPGVLRNLLRVLVLPVLVVPRPASQAMGVPAAAAREGGGPER
jgi:nucleotide-binding universal stress UspA family protein